MSTYGGDCWEPLNICRKRRVDELLSEGIEDDEVRMLSNGRLACIVCPQFPVLDSIPMLHAHRKGNRHQAAALKRQEQCHRLQQEIQKRIALTHSQGSCNTSKSAISPTYGKFKSSPLLAATKASKARILRGMEETDVKGGEPHEVYNARTPGPWKRNISFFSSTQANVNTSSRKDAQLVLVTSLLGNKESKASNMELNLKNAQCNKLAPSHLNDLQEQEAARNEHHKRCQRELKFREAGWRRDGLGSWFKDDNVEFDSDEEVPKNDTES